MELYLHASIYLYGVHRDNFKFQRPSLYEIKVNVVTPSDFT
jgi:hypothetical protein